MVVDAVPPGTRLLHLGPPKTGTTAIQVAMFEARAALAEHGVYIPGGSYRRRRAGWELGLFRPGLGEDLTRWNRLVAEIAAQPEMRVCLSNEDFARARPVHRDRIVDDVGAERTHLVLTARRWDRSLPSQWQERVKASVTTTFEDWLRVVLDPQEGSGEVPEEPFERWNVWVGHDTGALVRRWAARVPLERITVVVADESDHDLLSRVFAGLLAAPVDLLRTRPDRANRSLTWEETELVRAVGARFAERGWSRLLWKDYVSQGLLRELKARPRRPGARTAAPLPDWARAELRGRSEQRREDLEGLRAQGVRVVGDPADLLVPEAGSGGADVGEDVGPSAPELELAATAIEAVVARALELGATESGPTEPGGTAAP